MHDHCLRRGVPVWCGGMHEFGIGRAANVAIASLPGFTLPGDVSGSDKYYRRDIVEPPILAIGGAIAVPDSPGLGVEPVEDEIGRTPAYRNAARQDVRDPVMHDHPILNHLHARRLAMIAELKRLVEHESPGHDKPALDALAKMLAGASERTRRPGGGRRQSARGQPRHRTVSGSRGEPTRPGPHAF